MPTTLATAALLTTTVSSIVGGGLQAGATVANWSLLLDWAPEEAVETAPLDEDVELPVLAVVPAHAALVSSATKESCLRVCMCVLFMGA